MFSARNPGKTVDFLRVNYTKKMGKRQSHIVENC